MRIRFLTSTPLDVRRGSGTYVGIHVLERALTALGHRVEIESARVRLPIYTAQRLLFNRSLRVRTDCDLTVGFDMDGYRIAESPHHVASLKGVIADEVRFESGFTAFTMGMQARCERLHVERAALVIATSRYSAERAQEFYGLKRTPTVVPELIDLAEWRRLLAASPPADKRCFTVLFVGRFYRRKRVDVLLRAAAILRDRMPQLEVRLVGAGPCAAQLRALSSELKLDSVVTWLGDVSRSQLVSEYQRADLFCLPSVQEGFGIVLLEAMAAGKPIVAARAAAIPEVAPDGVLVEPENPEALAAGIEDLYRSPEKTLHTRHCMGGAIRRSTRGTVLSRRGRRIVRDGKPRGARRRHRRPGWSNLTLRAWHAAFSTRAADWKPRGARGQHRRPVSLAGKTLHTRRCMVGAI